MRGAEAEREEPLMHRAAIVASFAFRSARSAGVPVEVPGKLLGATRVRYGLETMCIGGGQGMAAIFERA
ncbi:MAG: hypothetical protein DI568_16330 [Sphingomonas sp.]|nr:MAG: hypothetical protein DI568_16330 [Sphingomonas sp.]